MRHRINREPTPIWSHQEAVSGVQNGFVDWLSAIRGDKDYNSLWKEWCLQYGIVDAKESDALRFYDQLYAKLEAQGKNPGEIPD